MWHLTMLGKWYYQVCLYYCLYDSLFTCIYNVFYKFKMANFNEQRFTITFSSKVGKHLWRPMKLLNKFIVINEWTIYIFLLMLWIIYGGESRINACYFIFYFLFNVYNTNDFLRFFLWMFHNMFYMQKLPFSVFYTVIVKYTNLEILISFECSFFLLKWCNVPQNQFNIGYKTIFIISFSK